MKKGIVLLLSVVLFLVGCSTMVVQTRGLPAPDHVLRGHVPAVDLQIRAACIRYYNESEGDELLETHEYIDMFEDTKHTIHLENLRSFVLSMEVFNPNKNEYRVVVDSEQWDEPQLIYEGNLSRKDFTVKLPAENSESYAVWYEIHDTDGLILFASPTVRYRVVDRLRSGSASSRYSK